MPQLLTSPEVVEKKSVGHRFFVQLVTEEGELDAWEQPVSKGDLVIDIVVSEPTPEAIKKLIAEALWFKNWVMVDY